MNASARPAQPYPGPRAFEASEGHLFYGRSSELRDLFALMLAHRAVLLYAQSGAGKSSLIKAGLLPQADQKGFDVLPVARVQGVDPARLGLHDVPNPYALNVLLSWAGPSADAHVLGRSRLAEFLAQRPARLNELGEPVPRVAVFDQFEELFTAYPESWKERTAFVDQIAEACARDPLLRCILVIREDHLAELVPLAPRLPGELRARLRLERLNEAAAVSAVEQPLLQVGRRFAPGVAAQLVKRLLKLPAAGGGSEVAQYVEPVQLQVVCQRLWQRLPDGLVEITEAQLEAFGDVDEALRGFYDEVVAATAASTGVGEETLRRWFDTELITQAGTRGTVFQGSDATGSVRNAAVGLLEDRHHIVRAELRHGSRWVELTHDRFVAPIRASNAVWLKRAATRRLRRRVGAGALAFVAAVAALGLAVDNARTKRERETAARQYSEELGRARAAADKKYNEDLVAEVTNVKARLDAANRAQLARLEEEQAAALQLQKRRLEMENAQALAMSRIREGERLLGEGQFERLRAEKVAGTWNEAKAEAVFDGVANYFWAKGDSARLATLLKANADLMPANYSLDSTALSLLPTVEADADWPLEVGYSPRAQIDSQRFQYYWRAVAHDLARLWNLPAPLRVQLKEDANLPADVFRIRSRAFALSGRATEAEAPAPEIRVRQRTEPGQVVASPPEAGQNPALRAFFDKHKLSPVTGLRNDREFWLLPGWTQPVFKVASASSFHREGAIAQAIGNEMVRQPELLLNRVSVAVLLDHLARSRPATVREALHARGLDRLVEDLMAIVRNRHGLLSLEYLLDSLANWPQEPPEVAAVYAWNDLEATIPNTPLLLPQGAGMDTLKTLRDEAPGPRRAYEETTPWFETARQPLRVAMGAKAQEQLAPYGRLTPTLLEGLQATRADFHRRFGFGLSGVRFRADDSLPEQAFRVEVARRSEADAGKEVTVPAAERMERLRRELAGQMSASRSWLLTPEIVEDTLSTLPAAQKTWLQAKYSTTALKLALRGVLGPDGAAPAAPSVPEQTLDRFAWLVRSLVFWSAIDPAQAQLATLARRLRELQRLRLGGKVQAGAVPDDVAQSVAAGLSSLQAGEFDAAQTAFRAAAARDRAAAVLAFQQQYPPLERQPTLPDTVARQCVVPVPADVDKAWWLAPGAALDLEAFVQKPPRALAPAERLRLELCLMRDAVAGGVRHQQVEASARRVASGYSAADWTPQAHFLFAQLLLKDHGKATAPPATLVLIQEALRNAFLGLPAQQASTALERLLELHASSWSAPGWHLELLRQIGPLREKDFWVAYLLASHFEDSRYEPDVQLALSLAERAHSLLGQLPEADRPRLQAWVELTRSQVRRSLAAGEPRAELAAPHWDKAVAALDGLLHNPRIDEKDWPGRSSVYASLVSVHLLRERFDAAERSLAEWRRQLPEDASALHQEALLRLEQLDRPGVVAVANRQLERSSKKGLKEDERLAHLKLAAMMLTLTGADRYEETGRKFMDSQHDMRDFVRLMLHWRLKLDKRDKDADELIRERAQRIDARTWPERLRTGDQAVWGEQLVLMFQQPERRVVLEAQLRSKSAFEGSPLSGAGYAYEAIATDFYFYGALLEQVSGPAETRQQRFIRSLQAIQGVGRTLYTETSMSRFLLAAPR